MRTQAASCDLSRVRPDVNAFCRSASGASSPELPASRNSALLTMIRAAFTSAFAGQPQATHAKGDCDRREFTSARRQRVRDVPVPNRGRKHVRLYERLERLHTDGRLGAYWWGWADYAADG